MRPIRLAFYVLLLFYHIAIVAVALNLTESFATSLSNSVELVKILSLIGLALFLLVFGFALYDRRHHRKRIARLEAEKNEVKAQVYDMTRRKGEVDREIKPYEPSVSKEETPAPKKIDPDQTTTS